MNIVYPFSFSKPVQLSPVLSNLVLYYDPSNSSSYPGSGTSIFDLKYPPTRDKTAITVSINSEIILDSDYSITLYTLDSDSYYTIDINYSAGYGPNCSELPPG
jgi:hypothetical protein